MSLPSLAGLSLGTAVLYLAALLFPRRGTGGDAALFLYSTRTWQIEGATAPLAPPVCIIFSYQVGIESYRRLVSYLYNVQCSAAAPDSDRCRVWCVERRAASGTRILP